MSLHDWALKHGVSIHAFDELLLLMGAVDGEEFTGSDKPETVVQNNVRIAASGQGWFLNRNNVGVLKDVTGRPVRYGLANDTKGKNKVLKSGDLYFSIYLPALMIGTVGGGTKLRTQTEARNITKAKNSEELARVLGGAVLAGELSLLASLAEGSLAKAHKKLGR